jgi:hypothetical protein
MAGATTGYGDFVIGVITDGSYLFVSLDWVS